MRICDAAIESVFWALQAYYIFEMEIMHCYETLRGPNTIVNQCSFVRSTILTIGCQIES